MKINLATSKNNVEVWYDSVDSHAATHIADTPNLDKLAAEVVEQTDISGPFMLFHVDLGRVVGKSDLVENDPDDELVWAKRKNREEYTVFNKSKSAQPSSVISVALEAREGGTYELVSTWIGPSDSPSFPGTERETPDSKDFWAKHALVWGNQEVQPGSETSICPW
jgi:hypothetical protein